MAQQLSLLQVRELAFSVLQLPAMWKLEETDNTRLNDDDNARMTSIGWKFLDKSSSNRNVKRYRVFYHMPTEKYGLVEISMGERGEERPSCLCSNMNYVVFNDFLKTKFSGEDE